jgi:Zn-dependent M16 (insulinase) family peptidase
MRIAVNAERKDFGAIESALEGVLLAALPPPAATPPIPPIPAELAAWLRQNVDGVRFGEYSVHSYFALPIQVNYAAQCFAAPTYTDPNSAPLRVLAQVMQANVVHREVREKGGAYGGGCGCSDGIFNFYSYRDPHSLETLGAFRRAVEWASAGGGRAISDRMIDEAKLQIFGSVDAPSSPAAKGGAQFVRGITPEMMQASRERLLGVDRAALVCASQQYLFSADARVCIFGPEGKGPEDDLSWDIHDITKLV